MKRLISFGKGFQFVGDTSQDPPPTVGELPKQPQPVRRIKSERMSIFRPMKDGNGYRPGPLIDLCTDQCRFSLPGGLMCGLKVVNGAWCGFHLPVVYPARRKLMEAAE